MDKFNNRLKLLRAQKGISQQRLADEIGISKSSVNMYERGEREPGFETLELFADYFNVDMNFLLGTSDIQNKFSFSPTGNSSSGYRSCRTAPVVGTVRCGIPILAQESIDSYKPIPYQDCDQYFWLRAQGDSMNKAGINDGDMILIREQPDVEDKEVAVVCVNGEESTVKRFHQQSSHIVVLIPDSYNSEYMPQFYDLSSTPVSIIGKVVLVEKEIK